MILRSSSDGQIHESHNLPDEGGSQYRYLRWSGQDICNGSRVPRATGRAGGQLRVLLANDDVIRIYDVDNAKWNATIKCASGGLGKIANVFFGADENEVLVFSEFAVKVTVWSLITSRGAEIRDPKTFRSHDYRPLTAHLAILTRVSAHDQLMLLSPGSYQASANAELPTVDAQGVKWSPDGQWLAIWDASSAGYKVLIYTADGHLFKSYEGAQTPDNIGLGIKTLAWHPQAAFLAVGDYDDHVTLLARNNVSSDSSYS